ncbi:hypothetical protein AUR04nite_00830 [Glutamicibacter uratoxydans]|uniref:Uncharacterized protein n=1 Tax=Glutamicibacter uratoxydans TaxID=43667 RepID=A0A4Y4DPQ5_GLUUR|nr:hypothetical protein [Glutamicibacter uratoxydans]GED04551.1 hypothetical protein AUR04nite_00830 [Glutamicibacter uratoxydans]
MSDAFEVTIESHDPLIKAKLVVKADTVQALHDRLVATVDAASFSLIGAAVSAMRDEAEAQRTIGERLEGRPDDAPMDTPPTSQAESASPAEKPSSNPWSDEQSAPNLPASSAPPAPQGGDSSLPPLPKWAQ